MEAAAQAEMTQPAGMLERPEMTPRLLADRLEETGGEALVERSFPWLMRRRLAQRQACSGRRCDDRAGCENCGNVVHIRRARRAKIGAQMRYRSRSSKAPVQSPTHSVSHSAPWSGA